MVEAITLECDSIADNPAYINEVTDVLSGTVNETLTPGGVIVISGYRIRIEGTKPEVGLQIVGTTKDAQAYSVAIAPPYVENKASKVIAVLPASIPDGTYRLQINTQYAGRGSLLKDIRVIISGADLIVGTIARSADTPTSEESDVVGHQLMMSWDIRVFTRWTSGYSLVGHHGLHSWDIRIFTWGECKGASPLASSFIFPSIEENAKGFFKKPLATP
jgi:hypothetical protein